MVLMIILQYKFAWKTIVQLFWKRFSLPTGLTGWGTFIGWMLLIMLVLNFLFVLAPFPLGFDARNYYVNISKLISEQEGLIKGYQPYSWGLIMSTGFIAFKSAGVALFISTLGGILALFAIGKVMIDFFKISANFTFLALFVFVNTPAITNQWIVEYKIDLTLVYTQMTVLLLSLHWIFKLKKKAVRYPLLQTKEDYTILLIIGILLGFGLSIKALAIFVIAGLFIGFWAISGDVIGSIAIALFGLSLTLLLKLDDSSGLRVYHENINITSNVTAALAVVMLILAAYRYRNSIVPNVKTSLLLGLFIIISFSPWMIKNYFDLDEKTLSGLVIGQDPVPRIHLIEIIENYEKSKLATPELQQ